MAAGREGKGGCEYYYSHVKRKTGGGDDTTVAEIEVVRLVTAKWQ